MFPGVGGAAEPAASPPPPPPPAAAAAKETRASFGSFPGLVKGNRNNKSVSLVEKKDFSTGVYGTSLPISSFSQQKSHSFASESDYSAERKFHSPEDKNVTGGVLSSPFYKDHYKAAMDQLAALNLSKNTRTSQLNSGSSKGPFHSWESVHSHGNDAVSRGFKKTYMEMPSRSIVPMNFISTNPVVHSFMKRCTPLPYPGMQKRLENCKNGEGDSFQRISETTSFDTYPATNSSSDDILSVIEWNLTRNCSEEEKHPAEKKNMSGNEKSKAMLSYFKSMNVKLKPEPIEHEEEISSSPESDTFSYPDFLPPPYNTLDLQKMSFSKFDDWKLSFNPPLAESLDKLISRLVQMERLQHLTILRERTKESVSPTVAFNSRPSCSKDIQQVKQKPPNFPCPQVAFDEDLPGLACFIEESGIAKCTCQHCHNNKWSLETPLPVRSSTKHCRASSSNLKYSKSPEISSHVTSRRSLSCSRSSQKIRSSTKTTSPKLLSPNTVEPCSLTDNESSKYKPPRTKRKSCRKNGALPAKSSNSQKLVSLSLISKQKCSHFASQ